MPSSPWPAPFPFPPPADRLWTNEESQYLDRIVQWRLENKRELKDIDQDAFDSLIKRLATSKGVKRYEAAVRYAWKENEKTLSYLVWLDEVLEGFFLYYPQITSQQETQEGSTLALQPTLARFATNNYQKIFKCYPTPDVLDDLIARVLLSLHESYFFDVALEPWLWKTTRYLLLNDIRGAPNNSPISLDDITDPHVPSVPADFAQNHIRHDLLCEAIKDIRHQRYRIILQLIYIYQLNNTELAAFFGVSVPRATTWLSRARSALKKQIQPHQLLD